MGQSLPIPTGAGPCLREAYWTVLTCANTSWVYANGTIITYTYGTVLTCANTSWAYANGLLMGQSLPIPTGAGPQLTGGLRDSPDLCQYELGLC
jgi:hypothetical protein